MMAHVGLSIATGSEKFTLEDSEGEKLAAAVEKVARHYDVPAVSSEVMDWIGLIIVCGSIYGPRLMAAKIDRMADKPKADEQQSDHNVVGLPGINRVPGVNA